MIGKSKENDENAYTNIDNSYITVDGGRQNPLIKRMPGNLTIEKNAQDESKTAEIKREREQRHILLKNLMSGAPEFQKIPREKQQSFARDGGQKIVKVSTIFDDHIFSYIKTGLLLLFILLSTSFLFLFAQKLLKSSNLKKTVDNQIEIISQQAFEISRLKAKLEDLDPKHTSVMLLGGYLFHKTDSITIYNSKQKEWQNCWLNLPYRVSNHGAVILENTLYIFGGYNGYESLYKLGENNKWIKLANMNDKRASIANSFLVIGSELWVIGGWNSQRQLETVEKFDPKSNNWSRMPEMIEPRSSAAAVEIGGKIYVSGGWDGSRTMKSIEVYDPVKGEWNLFGYLPNELGSHSSISNGTKLIIIGGDVTDYESTNEVWEIDVLDPNKKWKKLPSLLHKRCYHGVVELEDGLMTFGGTLNETTQIDSVEVFDGHSWKADTSLPEKRGRFSIIPLNSKQEKLFLNTICGMI